MGDIDALRKREIPFVAIVDAQGISGTSTVSLLRYRGMAAACQVDATGAAVDASTLAQLRARGILYFCQVNENGTDPVGGATLTQLMARGIPAWCPVDVNGIAQGGTSTIDTLRKRGIGYFCPLDENGTATTLATSVNYIAEGDSITLGFGGQPAYPFAAISQMPGGAAASGATNTPTQSSVTGVPDTVFITDIATSGISTLTIDQNYATRAGANFSSTKRLNVLSYMAGTNTSGASDTNFGQKYCLIRDYLRLARSTGYQRIVVGTTIARDDDAGVGWANVLVPLNSRIRALYNSDLQADGLADFGASATFSPASAADNTSFYAGDKIHPNAAGEVAMGTIMEPVLLAAFLGAGAQVLAPATWSTFSFDASGNGGYDGTTTLANSNRTIGVPTGFANYGMRGFPGVRSGKYYWEGLVTVANFVGFGIVNDNFTFNNSAFIGNDVSGNSISYNSDGAIKKGNSTLATAATFITGDIIGVAADFSAQQVWFRRSRSGVPQSWNGNGSADPVAGIGGVSFLLPAGVGNRLYPAGGVFTGTDSIISNFAASQLTLATPSGFNSGFGA